MTSSPSSLRAGAPWRVLDGFGRAVRSACRYAAPRDTAELVELLERCHAEGLPVAFRGAGRSYGDAALNRSGLVIDLRRLDRMLRWDPVAGIAEMEAGLSIEGLWRRTLEDGWWPAVVPGTMAPTIGGCVSMNVHGKNNFQAGPFGEHVLDLDLLTASGALLRCSREENAEVFRAVIGGAGLLGAVSRVRLRLKRVTSGLLRVEPLLARNFSEVADLFEERLPRADYLVGWIDAFAAGRGLGRGLIHQANYLPAAEDPEEGRSLHAERQGLPPRILGLPRSQAWRLMRALFNPPGVRVLNAAKYHLARVSHPGAPYLQSHAAFAFLLDYVPDWRLSYGPGGFIQHQLFVPAPAVRETIPALLRLCQERGLPPFLAVFKRHRPDEFLLTHSLDGYSLALDFPVSPRAPAQPGAQGAPTGSPAPLDPARVPSDPRLEALTRELTARVLDAGGSFYLAKDAVLRAPDLARAYGPRLSSFLALKARLDPDRLFDSDLSRRLMPAAAPSPIPATAATASSAAADPAASPLFRVA